MRDEKSYKKSENRSRKILKHLKEESVLRRRCYNYANYAATTEEQSDLVSWRRRDWTKNKTKEKRKKATKDI